MRTQFSVYQEFLFLLFGISLFIVGYYLHSLLPHQTHLSLFREFQAVWILL